MAEDKIQKTEELNEEQLDEVAGGKQVDFTEEVDAKKTI